MFLKTYLFNHISKKGYHFYTGKEFNHWVKKVDNRDMGSRWLRPLISKERDRSYRPEQIDKALENCLDSGKYTEECMLVVGNPFRTEPLEAVLLFVTEVPCSVKITMDSGEIFCGETEITKRHRVSLCDLSPAQDNQVHVELKWGDAVCYKKDVVVRTGMLGEKSEERPVQKTFCREESETALSGN